MLGAACASSARKGWLRVVEEGTCLGHQAFALFRAPDVVDLTTHIRGCFKTLFGKFEPQTSTEPVGGHTCPSAANVECSKGVQGRGGVTGIADAFAQRQRFCEVSL